MRSARAVPVPLREWVRRHVPRSVWATIRDVAVGRTAPQRAVREGRTRATAALAGGHRPGLTAVRVGGRTYVAREVETFTAGAALDDNLALVADALVAGGVPHLVLDAAPAERRVVVVRAPERAQALAALAAACADDVVYVGRPAGDDVRSPRVLRTARTLPRGASVLRVFRAYAGTGGGFVAGPTLGCDLEFWSVGSAEGRVAETGEPLPAGTLVAPRPNRWTDLLRPAEQETTTVEVGGVPRPVLTLQRRPHARTVGFPVDAVYTWVDGADPRWLARKAATLEAHGEHSGALHALATNASRFASRDELRYSLRSLGAYADWIRHVYLVTDDQVPDWLDTTNPRITVVSHRELFGDRGRLPTFNSHAIETQLHHLDGLSEHYLYLNDDVFFGRPVGPGLFFDGNGTARFAESPARLGLGPPSADDAPVMSAGKRNRELLAATFGVAVTAKYWHVPHALRRSVLAEMEERYAAEFARTASAQFRGPEDISVSASLAHGYGYLTGRAAPGTLRYFYADIAAEDTPARLTGVLERRDQDVICVNDHDSGALDPAEQERLVGDFLAAYFPVASEFERR